MKSWMTRDLGEIMGEEMLAHLNERFETSLDEGLKWRKRYAVEPIATTECQTARAICNIFTAQYIRAGMTKDDDSGAFKDIVDKMYGFALGKSVLLRKSTFSIRNAILARFCLSFCRSGVLLGASWHPIGSPWPLLGLQGVLLGCLRDPPGPLQVPPGRLRAAAGEHLGISRGP